MDSGSRSTADEIIKGQWTEEEDKILIDLVKKHGQKWSKVASEFKTRSGKQCRERWIYHHQPDIKENKWSEEEEKILIDAHRELGNKWSKIAKRLPGRTDNAIKNYFNKTRRKNLVKRSSCQLKPKSALQEYIAALEGHDLATEHGHEDEASLVLPCASEVLPVVGGSDGAISHCSAIPHNTTEIFPGEGSTSHQDIYAQFNEEGLHNSQNANGYFNGQGMNYSENIDEYPILPEEVLNSQDINEPSTSTLVFNYQNINEPCTVGGLNYQNINEHITPEGIINSENINDHITEEGFNNSQNVNANIVEGQGLDNSQNITGYLPEGQGHNNSEYTSGYSAGEVPMHPFVGSGKENYSADPFWDYPGQFAGTDWDLSSPLYDNNLWGHNICTGSGNPPAVQAADTQGSINLWGDDNICTGSQNPSAVQAADTEGSINLWGDNICTASGNSSVLQAADAHESRNLSTAQITNAQGSGSLSTAQNVDAERQAADRKGKAKMPGYL